MKEEKNIYKTGDVQMPNRSSRGGWTLMCILFLLCVISSLSMADMHLWNQRQEAVLLKFDYRQVPGPERGDVYPILGLTGCYLTELEQDYFSLPAGFYIAETSNPLLKPGDVLVSINGQPIYEQADFEEMIEKLTPDTEVTLQVQRGQRLVSVTDIFYEGDE